MALDWVDQNPFGDPDTPEEAWTDKVTGDRTPYVAYVLRAASCEGLLTPARASARCSASLLQHGEVLASKRNYTRDNHGLFADLGLARLTAFVPFADEAERWRALARERFETTLRRRLSQGVWLEHSSAYQFLAIRPLDSMLAVLGPDPELTDLRDEMRSAAAWFVKPDGEMTQFGDSNLEPVPDWAQGQAAGTRAYFGAGFAFVREPGPAGDLGYLAVTDGFHNLTHKHADELSFELFDHGASIVSDTGLYHKDPGEIRDYVLSNRAHSGLVVDGLDLPIADGSLAYGSGLTAAGEGDGWYAIEGRNPLLRGQGVAHTRLFLYRPGVGAGDRRPAALGYDPHLHALPAAAPGRRARRPRRGWDPDQRSRLRGRRVRRAGRQPGDEDADTGAAPSPSRAELAELSRVRAPLDARLRRHGVVRGPSADDRARPERATGDRGPRQRAHDHRGAHERRRGRIAARGRARPAPAHRERRLGRAARAASSSAGSAPAQR